MVKLISPIELWQDVVIPFEPDESISREYKENGNIYQEIYFNGVKTESGVTRVFGVFAHPDNNKKLPCILLCHDTNSSVDLTYVDYFLKMGFAVFMCDMYGVAENRKYTFYPDDIAIANKRVAGEVFYEVKTEAKDTMTYNWILLQRYALNYLRSKIDIIDTEKIAVVGIRDGATIAWQLAFVEKNIACSVALFYAGWREYGLNYKNDASKDEVISMERTAYIAAMSPQSCAPYISTPMLYLTASNDILGNLDRAFDTMARINGSVVSQTYITPNAINNLDYLATRDLKLWLNSYLYNKVADLPDKPILSVENFSNKLLAKCIVDDVNKVKKVTLFYSEGSFVPSSRCYLMRELSLAAGGYVGIVDISSSNQIFYAFLNVEYNSGFAVSSNFVSVALSELGLNKELVKENLIYNGLMGIDAFTGITMLEDYSAKGTFNDKPSIELVEGAGGIEGLKSSLSLSTFKLSHPAFSGESGEIFVFDVCCDNPTTISILAYCNLGSEKQDKFVANVTTVGGPLWQNFKLEITDFKNANNVAIEKWRDISLLMFSSSGEFIINNILWL